MFWELRWEGMLSGADRLGCQRSGYRWAFDAVTHKRGGNELDQIFHRGSYDAREAGPVGEQPRSQTSNDESPRGDVGLSQTCSARPGEVTANSHPLSGDGFPEGGDAKSPQLRVAPGFLGLLVLASLMRRILYKVLWDA